MIRATLATGFAALTLAASGGTAHAQGYPCLLYTSPSPRD